MSVSRAVTGRFAPSPTGPLHSGSLVAALGSWLFARAAGGRWLVRLEDLDTPRIVPGAADEILRALERYGLTWDGEIVFQSARLAHYDAALEILRKKEMVYACACSRADLAGAASAPDRGDPLPAGVYPGTCRAGLPPGKETRAVRFRVPAGAFTFEDLVFGPVSEDVSVSVGDFGRRAAARDARRGAPQGDPCVRSQSAGAGASGGDAPGDAEGSTGALFPRMHSARASASTGRRTATGMNARRSHDQRTCHAGESRVNAKEPVSAAA